MKLLVAGGFLNIENPTLILATHKQEILAGPDMPRNLTVDP
jgi:hypothetical protein